MMKWRKIKTVYTGMCEELAEVLGIYLKRYHVCIPDENLIINDMGFYKGEKYRCALDLIKNAVVVQNCYDGMPGGMVILPTVDFSDHFILEADEDGKLKVEHHKCQFYDAEKDQES